jgi:hypothetical protein
MAPERPRKVPVGSRGPQEGASEREPEPPSAAVTAALDRLFAAPFDEFVALRREIALGLRKEGDAAGARVVAAFAKPSRTAWALNQVARRHPDLVQHALDAWARAAASPKAGDVGDVRATARVFRERTSDIVDAAEEIARQDGADLNVAAGRRIAATLQAVAGGADAAARERLIAGRLAVDVDVDDPFAGLEVGEPREPSSPRARSGVEERSGVERGVGVAGAPARAATPVHARPAVAPARDAAVARRAAPAAEEAERGRAREREREKRAKEIETARARVSALETEAREARAAARDAEVAANRAQADAQRARRAVEGVEIKLEEARGELRALAP